MPMAKECSTTPVCRHASLNYLGYACVQNRNGRTPDSTAIDIAAASVRDGVCSERMLGLWSLAQGDPSKNERGLHRWLNNLFGHDLEFNPVEFQLQTNETLLPKPVSIPTIPIWQLMKSLHSAGPLQFQVSMLGRGGSAAAQRFWEQALLQAWGREHPALAGKHGDALGHVIPLQIHMDGAEMFKNAEYYVFSISCALNHKSNIFDSKFQMQSTTFSGSGGETSVGQNCQDPCLGSGN